VNHLSQLAESAAQRMGDNVCLEFDGEQFTYQQLFDSGLRMQAGLAAHGFAPGTRAIVLSMNNRLLYPLFQGIYRTGATAIPVMPQAAAPELRYVIEDTQAQYIITDVERLATAREAAAGLPYVREILVAGGADEPNASPPIARLDSLLDFAPAETMPPVSEDDVAVMLYSSGTTGRPKGVLLTHRNLIACAEAVSEASELHTWQGDRVTLSAMPIAHIFGVAIMHDLYMTPTHMAERSRLIQMKWFDPERFMQMIAEHKISTFAAVPTILAVMLAHPAARKFDMSSITEVICGGAPLPVELGQAFMQRFDCRVREVYGLTEATGLGTVSRRSVPFRAGSAGRPYLHVELAILDDEDRPVATGERGEICMRGPSVMRGYHNRPAETEQILRSGWLHTGDVGYLDDEGFLYVVDRKKDMIIRGGENIYPAELEAVLHEHAGVVEAAVVGVPDAIYGENVVAFVVPRPGVTVAEPELVAHVCTRVARFKAPSRVHFLPALPKSGLGKILRRVLRDQAAAQATPEVTTKES
jgi:long-chain acyl-CoA synthetase